jgi:signal transduction histidine kinase
VTSLVFKVKELKKEYFKFLVVILVVIGVVGISNALLNYFLLERSVAIEFKADYGLVRQVMSLYGEILNDRIEEISEELLEIHRRIEKDLRRGVRPTAEYLSREKAVLAKKIRGRADIAIIDRRGVIVETTYSPEKNLDLSKFEDVRSALKEVARRREIRVDFPIMESKGRFYRLYTLSYLPDRKIYVQLGYKLDMLDELPELFAPQEPGAQYATTLYSVFYTPHSSSVTCISNRKVRIPARKKQAVLKALATAGDVVVENAASGEYSVFKEIRLGAGRNWNNSREYRLVLGVDFGFGEQYFLVRLSRWINLAGIVIILLIVFYGYRKLDTLLVYPLAEVSSRMDESRPVAVDRLDNACREIVTIAEAYNLHLENIKIRNFARDLITAQEEERKRIARELHDSVGQDLSLALISLDMIARQYPETREFTAGLSQALKHGMAEIKDLIFNLDSESISRLGLVAACEDCIERFRGMAGFKVDFTADLPDEDGLDISVSTNLYRILQEALNNAAKHSRARRVKVELGRSDGDVVLTVSDDGVGFDSRAVRRETAAGRHFGLTNMEERCRLLSGSFELRTEPGRGCRIIVRIPVSTGEGVA